MHHDHHQHGTGFMRRALLGALAALTTAGACLTTAAIGTASPAAPNTIHAFKQANGATASSR
jgi:hypothetical protein